MIELKPFDRTDRELPRLNAALHLYRKLIPEEARNPDEQIIYWINNGKYNLTDDFKCLSIHSNGEVIGYFQYSYFADEHMFFFEYLCLANTGRKGLFRRDFVTTLENYIVENYRPGFIIAFESVRNKINGEWIPDNKKLKYYDYLGFRRVDFEYRYPALQSYGEQSYPADLMVRLPDNKKSISASELRMVLRAIYFKHYLRWDKPFLDKESMFRREELINNLFTREVQLISNKTEYITEGTERVSPTIKLKPRLPSITPLLKQIFFRNPLLRLSGISILFLLVRKELNNDAMFIPFVLSLFAAWCLIDEKNSSKKLFVTILNHLVPRPTK